MKLFRISLLLFCAVLFSSCVGEWMDRDCQGDFTLYFEFHPTGNPNPVQTFLTNVQTVDLFVYNEAGSLVWYRPSVGQHQMQSSRGATRSGRPGIDLPIGNGANELTPGNRYRVVAWGNVDRGAGRNSFENQNQVNNARIRTAADSGTPLHFGPGALRGNASGDFWVTINDTMDDEYAVLRFTRAHIEIQVFVAGASEVPRVDLDRVAGEINFNNVVNNANRILFTTPPSGMRAGFTPSVPGREQRPANYTSFYVPLFDEDTDKMLEITNSLGLLPNGSVSIADVIAGTTPSNINVGIPARLNLADTNNPVETIQIVLEIAQDVESGYDVVVGIWLPGWIQAPVDPWNPPLW